MCKPITCFSPKPLSVRLIKPPHVILFEDNVTLNRSQRAEHGGDEDPKHPRSPGRHLIQTIKGAFILWNYELVCLQLVWCEPTLLAWLTDFSSLFSFLLTDLLIRVACIINRQWLASRLKWRTPGAPALIHFKELLNGSTTDRWPPPPCDPNPFMCW